MGRLQSGQTVTIDGLEARAHLNGHTGTLVSREPGTGRWRVRLKVPPYLTTKVDQSALQSTDSALPEGSIPSREMMHGPMVAQSHATIAADELAASLGKMRSSTASGGRTPRSIMPPVDRLQSVKPLFEHASINPLFVKGELYRSLERGAPRTGGRADIQRGRIAGLSFFKEVEAHKRDAALPSTLHYAAAQRPAREVLAKTFTLQPLSTKALKKLVEEAETRRHERHMGRPVLDARTRELLKQEDVCEACVKHRLSEEAKREKTPEPFGEVSEMMDELDRLRSTLEVSKKLQCREPAWKQVRLDFPPPRVNVTSGCGEASGSGSWPGTGQFQAETNLHDWEVAPQKGYEFEEDDGDHVNEHDDFEGVGEYEFEASQPPFSGSPRACTDADNTADLLLAIIGGSAGDGSGEIEFEDDNVESHGGAHEGFLSAPLAEAAGVTGAQSSGASEYT
eukprot:TRINITY_DN68329_c0_g1_i1.p1 TRINITY_DN68329_c0_g1~~TRINITY_DN68329_c0_g1_i1.p1  ORF type:complete len:452 (-),score=71.86 TRINITY_DN68329_c0_g1_i1:165-1520(-)